MTRRTRVLFFLALLFVAALPVFALEVPPSPTQWFTDKAGLVPPTEGDLLNRKLEQFEQSSGAQFIIYIFPSLEGEALEDFTIRCAESWKVGQKKYDNGLILFVFSKERKVRVEAGYGLEGTITDAFASRVIREHIAPSFQRSQYGAGLNAAADAIIAQIRKGEAPVEPMQQRGARTESESDDEGLGVQAVIFILVIVFFVIVPMFTRGRRRGGCGGCILPFFMPGGITLGGGGFSSGGGFGGFSGGGGGFSGGGGGFGGGGASGGW